MAPGWDRVLTVFADGAFAFRKGTRRGGAFYRRGAFPTASRHWFHLRRSRSAEPVQTERNEISGVEALRYARSLCAPARDPPFSSSSPSRESIFSARRLRGEVGRVPCGNLSPGV